MRNEGKPKVVTRWRYADVPLSPAWIRLVGDLSASRKGGAKKPAGAETSTAEKGEKNDAKK